MSHKANDILESLKAYGIDVAKVDYGFGGLPETLLVTVPATQLLHILKMQKNDGELRGYIDGLAAATDPFNWEGLGDA